LLDFSEAMEEISHHKLWDVPMSTGATALISIDQSKGFAEVSHTDDPNFIEPRDSANISRKNPQVHKDAPIFIAVAWASKNDIRLFMLFPEVFHASCICDTNNTNNHLLTFSYPTSRGKQVVFLGGLDSKSEEASLPLGFKICTDQLI
jgi:hypothetical protein